MNVTKEYYNEYLQTINHVKSLTDIPNGPIRINLLHALSLLKSSFVALNVEPLHTITYLEDPGPPPDLNVEPPKGANDLSSEKVSFNLDFLGRWKTRGGCFVEVTKFTKLGEWTGHHTDRQGLILYWDQNGENTIDTDLDLVEKLREAQKFANG